MTAWAGMGEQYTGDPMHDLLHLLIQWVPRGAGALLLFLGWAFRERIKTWVQHEVKKAMGK